MSAPPGPQTDPFSQNVPASSPGPRRGDGCRRRRSITRCETPGRRLALHSRLVPVPGHSPTPFLRYGILCHHVSRTAVGNDSRAGSHHAMSGSTRRLDTQRRRCASRGCGKQLPMRSKRRSDLWGDLRPERPHMSIRAFGPRKYMKIAPRRCGDKRKKTR
jgi:hypothetical protein